MHKNEEEVLKTLQDILSKEPSHMIKDEEVKNKINYLADDKNSDVLVKVIENNLKSIIDQNKYSQEKLITFLNLLMDSFCNIYTKESKSNAKDIIEVVKDKKVIEDKKELVRLVLKALVWEYIDEQSNENLVRSLAAFVTDDEKQPDFKKPILILGPTGTGKELIAEAIHLIGSSRKSPFIAINCSAIPETLIEAELFGYVKGTFTGAIMDKIGYIEEAGDGTIFIDEVGDMRITTQTKLLRLLNNKIYSRLGETTVKTSNARFVFATNKNLRELIKEKAFKEDFYYRIETFTIKLSSMKDDLQNVAEEQKISFFEEKIDWRIKKYGLTVDEGIKDNICRKLADYEWKGNYRQLYSVLDRAFAYAKIEGKLTEEMFELEDEDSRNDKDITIDVSKMTFQEVEEYADSFVREKLRQVLQRNRGNLIRCAVEIGITSQEELDNAIKKDAKRISAIEKFKRLCLEYGINHNEFANKNDKRRKFETSKEC